MSCGQFEAFGDWRRRRGWRRSRDSGTKEQAGFSFVKDKGWIHEKKRENPGSETGGRAELESWGETVVDESCPREAERNFH